MDSRADRRVPDHRRVVGFHIRSLDGARFKCDKAHVDRSAVRVGSGFSDRGNLRLHGRIDRRLFRQLRHKASYVGYRQKRFARKLSLNA